MFNDIPELDGYLESLRLEEVLFRNARLLKYHIFKIVPGIYGYREKSLKRNGICLL